ncbi:MAG: 1-acyl-sn-glycerol-3-phosphate acyltransferase [Anaerolineaceae bacterium]|jgi:1-acyl-sn-glycerol-3-phosphate acyltransferase|nr:1-acyl-sn-glycerol-3-phosphate acyltransferase [Anaerolineae bacterium]MBL1173388.1 1-acyl-sn-glycerol-3-phosphate acyltransferase [Chloroflexota bacterium]MCE7904272.1 1-acyl-sn-glycerol-3-phosphate acyltransferase [Anaerolineae bacterium CFX3]MDL1924955.1 1-acyl-sn-glycerol-3-phosphate acyltransferase [Anaerolineae bacterium AMX1]MDX9935972.1 lysophospholipid acyltransferase family protein [Anaerolineales bacterium]GER79894.1 lysophospholipid acyltransferases, LPLATs [Candidatus Denitroli
MRNFLRWLIRSLLHLIARVDVRGYENLPTEESYVLATNHIGILDAILPFVALNRWDIYIPVAEKWEKNRFLNWLGNYFNFVFIDRFNPDIKAMRKLIRLMEDGNALGISPEGTRSRVGSLIEAKPGVTYLATKLNRPIVPVAITGTEDKALLGNLKRLRKSRITVTAGPYFTLPPIPRENRDEALKQSTDEIMCRIAALLPEKYRGVYAEHPRTKELLGGD